MNWILTDQMTIESQTAECRVHGLIAKGFIVLKKLAVLSIGVGLSLTGTAGAQEHNLPAMNSVGRFFGIGWSNGYHSGTHDGRFQAVKARHSASQYGSRALQYPYHPGYEPQRSSTQLNSSYAQPFFSNTSEIHSSGSFQQSISNQAVPTPAPAIPPKPVEPPPARLRPFLQDDEKGALKDAAQRSGPKETGPKETGPKETSEGVEAIDASPSDLRVPKPEPKKPIDQGKEKSSGDDDLLTLNPPLDGLQRYNEARNHRSSVR